MLALLCFAPGMFAAATALLPSSFAMYAMTAAAAAVIDGRPMLTVASAAVGIVWGWVVAGLAFVPYALYVLAVEPLRRSVPAAAIALMCTAVPLMVADRVFYGSWKVSMATKHRLEPSTRWACLQPTLSSNSPAQGTKQ